MPRARTPRPEVVETSETTPVVKRVTRRRAPIARVDNENEGTLSAPLSDSNSGATTDSPAPVRRKAPRLVSTPASPSTVALRRKRGYVPFVVVGLLFIISIGVSAMVGLSDKGSIDVGARMNEQSALQAANNGGTSSDGTPSTFIPVQNSQPSNVPNGGLVPISAADQAALPPPIPLMPPEVTATTSSSTEGIIATSSTPAEIPETATTTSQTQ